MAQNNLRRNLLIALTTISFLTGAAHYTVHELIGHVQLKQGLNTIDVVTGMNVKPTDLIIIPEHAAVKILDTRNSRIYESTSAGQMSVTRIVFDASKKASDNSSSVHDKLRMREDKSAEGIVLVEKGKVTRVLREYDPNSDQIQLDIDQLANKIYAALRDSTALDANDEENSPIVIRHKHNEQNGLSFMVENGLPFSIYFNVIKPMPDNGVIEISELGQPVGSYVLQPDQSMARTQHSGLNPNDDHVLIVTNYYFDVDELLTKLNDLSKQSAPSTAETPDFPLLIRKM